VLNQTNFASFTPDGKQYKTTFNPADVYKNGKDGDRIPGTENIILLKTENGRTKTDLSEEQRNVAKRVLKSQTGVQVDKKVERETERMKFEKSASKDKADRDRAKGEKDLDSQVSMIGNLYYGENDDIKAATEYFRDQNPDIQKVVRNADGISVSFKNEAGEIETRDISFYTDVENPDFDSSLPESDTNPKTIKKRKSQSEFIKSAGPLLTGESNIDEALERGNYNEEGEFNETDLSVESGIDVKDDAEKSYKVATDSFLREKTSSIDFGKKQDKLAEEITNAFANDPLIGDLLSATPVGGASNIVEITIDGSGLDPIKLDGNNYTKDGKNTEMKKLIKYIRQSIKNIEGLNEKLAEKNNWSADETDENGL